MQRHATAMGGGLALIRLAAWLGGAVLWLSWLPAQGATGAPPPAAELVVTRAADGSMQASGSLPKGLPPARVAALLPELGATGSLSTGGAGTPARWEAALEALNIALPRIAVAEIRLRPGILALRGRLKPGVSRKEVRPALRAALGPDWRLDFDLSEVPPEAEIAFEHDAGGTRLSGLLPAGISPRQALTALGGARDDGLAGGAGGAPGAWARAFAVLDTVLRGYHRARGTLSAPGGLAVEGRLAPGQERAALADWARGALPGGWTVRLEGRGAPAAEGATRFDPATRRTETLRGGRWIPDIAFPAGTARCNAEAARLQRAEKLRFDPGADRLGDGAAALLDRLAGLARNCLAGTGLLLEIGGHTDAVGAGAANLALSAARAESVLAALAARGVPRAAMTARGYGATRPVADNDIEAGRARNRRISFDFRAPAPSGDTQQALER